MLERLTSRAYGALGNSQAGGTVLCTLGGLGPGRYKVWGNMRHSLTDGVRLVATGQSNLILASTADNSGLFGPIVMDLTSLSNTISLELQTATGASDTASGNLYVQRLNP